jgi:hypothetical protein
VLRDQRRLPTLRGDLFSIEPLARKSDHIEK